MLSLNIPFQDIITSMGGGYPIDVNTTHYIGSLGACYELKGGYYGFEYQ